jgi:hypothetical protein
VRIDEVTAYNLLFREGTCDICGGKCFCILDNHDLVERLMSGLKRVGTFAFTTYEIASQFNNELQNIGLTTFMGQNRWTMELR